jgi:peptide chain release factor 3
MSTDGGTESVRWKDFVGKIPGWRENGRFMNLESEVGRRRTFAIISHPDAGKTTLTEKFLLYGGAVQLAGAVTGKKKDRATASDWMELEKQRGISVSSTVLQFPYGDYCVNLLDTPGHEDFSEDTYRVLTAVDAAIMVIDAAKGIEAQTRKLFEVCRMRGLPIFTFVNKCDRPGKGPLALLDEIESVLGLAAYPMNWPMGDGAEFGGLIDRRRNQAHFFERVSGGRYRAAEKLSDLADDTSLRENLSEAVRAQLLEEIEMLDMAGAEFDAEAVMGGRLTPVFFGSALNNFGVRLLLDDFLALAPAPRSRKVGEQMIEPARPEFSGFVFKIQANMDPQHRDRVAFIRICSGRFSRDMSVLHAQSGKKIRLSFSQRVFGRERETQDEAWPGDVIGIAGNTELGLGDTVTEDPAILFRELPRFPPECFAYLRNEDMRNYKRFRAGLEQMLHEKVVQRFHLANSADQTPFLGAVGPLQFDVVRFRLESEYRAPSRLDTASWTVTRWVGDSVSMEQLRELFLPSGAALATDDDRRPVMLFSDEWNLRYFSDKHPEIPLHEYPPEAAPRSLARETG